MNRTVLALCLVGLCWGIQLQAHDWTKTSLPQVQQAADQGDAVAQFMLGGRYLQGIEVEKDDQQAVFWFRKAAENGLAYAQASLGSMYNNGQGVAKDERQAVYWYRKAAEQGYSLAQFGLGNLYTLGKGVVQDYRLAYVWFAVAAANGYADAAPFRDFLAEKLPPPVLADAQTLAGEYFEKYQPKH